MSKGSFSISAAQGRVAHEHDERDYTPHNADVSLRDRNIMIKTTEDYKSAFNDLFRDSIIAHNAKQTREDRKKSFDYYSTIDKSEGPERCIYEYVFQVGSRDTLGVTDNDFDYDKWQELKREGKFRTASEYVQKHLNKDPRREQLKTILTDVMSGLENKYPKFRFWLIYGHDDEPGGTLHYHVAFTPVADGYKKGMPIRNSLSKALSQMGFKTDSSGYAIQKWQNEIKDTIEAAMVKAGYERQYINNTEKHLSVYQFKLKTANEKLTQENSELQKENKKLQESKQKISYEVQELEDTVNLVNYKEYKLAKREEALNARESDLNQREGIILAREQKAVTAQNRANKAYSVYTESRQCCEKALKQIQDNTPPSLIEFSKHFKKKKKLYSTTKSGIESKIPVFDENNKPIYGEISCYDAWQKSCGVSINARQKAIDIINYADEIVARQQEEQDEEYMF